MRFFTVNFNPPPKSVQVTGFTLIEMAIVLVIIGLIVGGIVVGQNLINSATERAEITQIEKYNQAVNTFYGKYSGLPGDLSVPLATQFGFYSTSSNSLGYCKGLAGGRDGNGIIASPFGGGYANQSGEALLFWSDLSQAGLIDGIFPNSGATPGSGGSNDYCNAGFGAGTILSLTPGSTYIGDFLPKGKIEHGTFLQVYYTGGGLWYGDVIGDAPEGGGHWYSLNTVNNTNNDGGTNNPGYSCTNYFGNCPVTIKGIPQAMAYDIDAKIDDGLPQTGSVTAYFISGNATLYSSQYSSSSINSYMGAGTNGTGGCSGGFCGMSFKMQGY